MGTFVNTNGSGVDLSSLTSGELTLIGLLNNGIFRLSGQRPVNYIGILYQSSSNIYCYLDMSAIVSIEVKTHSGSAFDIDAGYGTGSSFTQLGSQSVYTTAVQYNVSGIPSTQSSGLMLSSSGTCNIQWLSFTTTDGKVHTASNLNY